MSRFKLLQLQYEFEYLQLIKLFQFDGDPWAWFYLKF